MRRGREGKTIMTDALAAPAASGTTFVPGPTYEEMLHPRGQAPNNLYRIGWHGVPLVLPREVTGVEASIVVMLGYTFPSGSHKVGPTYAIVMEAEKDGLIAPGRTRLIGPSTGNFGIGTAWTTFQKGYDGVVVMPDGMSPERTARIRAYGSDIIFTPGTESDVILTIEKAKELGREPDTYVLAQFENFANYRFHYHVTGNSVLEKVHGRIRAFVSAPGSAGTIAAGDRIKEKFADAINVAAEPVQCATLYHGGVGQHQIEGIGDKMAPLVLNINTLDRVALVDDQLCVDLLHYFVHTLNYRYEFGISGMCNVIAAIQTAKTEGYGAGDVVVTVATDGLDRYYSYMDALKDRSADESRRLGPERVHALRAGEAYLDVTTAAQRERLYALKASTWATWYSEEYLESLKSDATWQKERERIKDYDAR
jgi:cysteine synthase